MISSAHPAVVLAAISSDSDAYRLGRAVGVLLLLALGVGLLVLGLRRQRKASRQPSPGVAVPSENPAPAYDAPSAPPTSAPPAAGDYFAPAPPSATPQWAQPVAVAAPSTRGGIPLIVAGAVVLLLAVLGGVGALSDISYPKRTISMPDTVLGEPKNEASTATLRSQFVSSLPAEIKTSDIGVYGTGTPDLIVIAGTGHLSSPSSELASFRKGFAGSGSVTISGERKVAAGGLGGQGRCFDAQIGTVPLEVCAFADRGSLLATIDRTADRASAGTRAQQVRDLVIHKS